jgi:hypothetical protein
MRLQEKGELLPEVFSDIKAFEIKSELINKHVEDQNLAHFPPVKAFFFFKHLEKKGLRGQRKNFQKLSSCFKMNFHQDSKIFTLIPVKFFFFKPPFKLDVSDVDELQMDVIELQTNGSLKNAFEPSDMRIFYSQIQWRSVTVQLGEAERKHEKKMRVPKA